jgi:hypothetical protein
MDSRLLTKFERRNMAYPSVAVAITKATDWHGAREEFDNVYYYDGPFYQAGSENYLRLAEKIVAAERLVHGSNVEFMRYRVWSAGGTIAQNITLGLVDLDGYGTLGSTSMFKEAAAVIEWETDRSNTLGRKVYLRKFIRPCAIDDSSNGGIATGVISLAGSTMATKLKTYADSVDYVTIPVGAVFQLVSPTGRIPRASDNGVVNSYMRSREFRRN